MGRVERASSQAILASVFVFLTISGLLSQGFASLDPGLNGYGLHGVI
ncbi:MAG TPA: hypothetical protein VLY63_21140 [Anaerolineae bacterium]|nr:hypothetical protein [Anaerolineae bacterium]